LSTLSAENIFVLFLSLGLLLGLARGLGELVRKFGQPPVLGELLAGVLLGPTVFGTLSPDLFNFLFPSSGPNSFALDAIATLAIVMFLLIAGIDVDLSTLWKQGSAGLKVGASSLIVPMTFGFLLAWFMPELLGVEKDSDHLVFALFFATVISISALPVIARILMDLRLYRTDFGMVVISAAVLNDVVGWMLFAFILGMVGSHGPEHGILLTILLTIGFTVFMLTIGRWLIDRAIPYLRAHTHGAGGVLSFALTLALLGAAVTEWIGVHAIFGAFLVGIAIGDSEHLREQTRTTIDQFVSNIFVPIFFASVGLRANFILHFDLNLVLTVLAFGIVAKLIGGTLGARWSGLGKRDSLGIGFAMNTHGAMEIILGLVALQLGIIQENLFVTIVILTIVTSMMSGPVIKSVLQISKGVHLVELLSSRLFIRRMTADSPRAAIRELVSRAADALNLDEQEVCNCVMSREDAMPTGIGNGIAIPHARVPRLKKPVVVAGIAERGIDFDSPDGEPASLLFLILSPEDDPHVHLTLMADIAQSFHDPAFVQQGRTVRNYSEFIAILKAANPLAEG